MKVADIIAEEAKRLFSDSFYAEQELHEVGEADATPYSFKTNAGNEVPFIDDEDGEEITWAPGVRMSYDFTTASGIQYKVKFRGQNILDSWIGSFDTSDNEYKLTGDNDQYRVMSTIVAVMREFVETIKPAFLKFEAIKESDGDMRRLNVYMAYIRKNLGQNYEVSVENNVITITAKQNAVNEVGEGDKHQPYPWQESAPVDGNHEYVFTTEDGDQYEVQMQDVNNYWNIDFKTRGGGFKEIINKGRFFQVMATLVDVIKDFLIKEDPRLIRISPAKNSVEDQRRFNIYKHYLDKQMPPQYEVTLSGDFIYVQKIIEENHEAMGISAIIQEELQALQENLSAYTIPQLAQMLADTKQQHQESVGVLQNMLFDEFKTNGDAGVEKMYAAMSGVEIEALTRGRYVFANLTGGGEPMLEIQDNANHMPNEMPWSM